MLDLQETLESLSPADQVAAAVTAVVCVWRAVRPPADLADLVETLRTMPDAIDGTRSRTRETDATTAVAFPVAAAGQDIADVAGATAAWWAIAYAMDAGLAHQDAWAAVLARKALTARQVAAGAVLAADGWHGTFDDLLRRGTADGGGVTQDRRSRPSPQAERLPHTFQPARIERPPPRVEPHGVAAFETQAAVAAFGEVEQPGGAAAGDHHDPSRPLRSGPRSRHESPLRHSTVGSIKPSADL